MSFRTLGAFTYRRRKLIVLFWVVLFLASAPLLTRVEKPLKVGGFVGWVIWLFIHIAFLTGYRNRVGALFTWWFAFTRDIRRERTFTTQQIETLGDVYTRPLGPMESAAVPQSVAADQPSSPAPPGGSPPGGEPRTTT